MVDESQEELPMLAFALYFGKKFNSTSRFSISEDHPTFAAYGICYDNLVNGCC